MMVCVCVYVCIYLLSGRIDFFLMHVEWENYPGLVFDSWMQAKDFLLSVSHGDIRCDAWLPCMSRTQLTTHNGCCVVLVRVIVCGYCSVIMICELDIFVCLLVFVLLYTHITLPGILPIHCSVLHLSSILFSVPPFYLFFLLCCVIMSCHCLIAACVT
jgi:hypothetical protein